MEMTPGAVRNSQRFHLFERVQVFHDGQTIEAFGFDVSAEGMRLRSNRELQPGSQVAVEFSTLSGRIRIERSEVVWAQPFDARAAGHEFPVFAVRFAALEGNALETLKSFLAQATPIWSKPNETSEEADEPSEEQSSPAPAQASLPEIAETNPGRRLRLLASCVAAGVITLPICLAFRSANASAGRAPTVTPKQTTEWAAGNEPANDDVSFLNAPAAPFFDPSAEVLDPTSADDECDESTPGAASETIESVSTEAATTLEAPSEPVPPSEEPAGESVAPRAPVPQPPGSVDVRPDRDAWVLVIWHRHDTAVRAFALTKPPRYVVDVLDPDPPPAEPHGAHAPGMTRLRALAREGFVRYVVDFAGDTVPAATIERDPDSVSVRFR